MPYIATDITVERRAWAPDNSQVISESESPLETGYPDVRADTLSGLFTEIEKRIKAEGHVLTYARRPVKCRWHNYDDDDGGWAIDIDGARCAGCEDLVTAHITYTGPVNAWVEEK